MGWDRLPDGQLLSAAEAAGYELLITPDQDIQYQQNVAGMRMAILVLMNNDWRLIRPHVYDIADAVNRIQPAEYIEFAIPFPPRPEDSGG